MTEPVNNKTLGGLTYNANLVKSAKKLKNGQYEIIFKSGEKFTYPEQKNFHVSNITFDNVGNEQYKATGGETIPNDSWHDCGDVVPRNAKVEQKIDDGLIYDDTYFDITNVMGAHFSSSKETVSHVKLNNSSNTTINLAANDSKWYADDAKIDGGANNKVILDGQDTAKINGRRVKGEGTAAQKDYE